MSVTYRGGISTSATGDIYAKTSWVPYNKEGSLVVLNMLESSVNPEGCIYNGTPELLDTVTNDMEYWKAEMLKVTSKYSTDREKALELAKFLKSRIFHLDLATTSYTADSALKDKMFVGVCGDIADVYCLGLSQAGIPSVVINGKMPASNSLDLSQGHAVNGVYYDGAWHYYDVMSYSDLNKEELSNRFYADAIWGIRETEDYLHDNEAGDISELNLRLIKSGYATVN